MVPYLRIATPMTLLQDQDVEADGPESKGGKHLSRTMELSTQPAIATALIVTEVSDAH